MILAMLLLLVMMINEFRYTKWLNCPFRCLVRVGQPAPLLTVRGAPGHLGPELLQQVLALQVPDLDGGPGGRAQPVPADGQA